MYELPPTSISLNDAANPADVIDALFLGPFLAGSQPVARSSKLEHVKADAALAPADAIDVRRAHIGSRRVFLARGEGWTLHGSRWGDQATYLTVTAVDDATAVRVLADAAEDALEPAPVEAEEVRIGFWSRGPRGPVRLPRQVAITPWPEIRRNYTAPVVDAFDRLMAHRSDPAAGRLLLFHGPPGTGKTTALRALAHAWRSWCDLEYVLDPEQLLRDPGYLLQAASGDEDDDRWRLLVLEDCDELIRADAKAGSGQALARLLNLTDGILGQGLQVLVAITTNEPLARLHPAIVRAGRCLAQVEVGPLTPAEAHRWLGAPVLLPVTGATLADLIARASGALPIEAAVGGREAAGYL
jgi:hypothetical protein